MRRTFLLHRGMPTLCFYLVIQTLGFLVLWLFHLSTASHTHAAAPITPSGLNTQVNVSSTPPAGKVQYDITGGTRPGGGVNLFHSFGNFNVPTNNIANFLNDSGLPTSNILGRVTGGNPSTIFGTIQTTGFGNANLFLMNPAGFLFGPTATVNVGGMVAFTTADYMRLADGVLFNHTPNVAQDALLSAAPVAAFGFLGSNAAAIAIQGSTLQVAQGQTLSFVSGNQGFTYMDPDTGNIGSVPGGVTMTGGQLSAPGGQINLVSVASPGEILFSNLQLGANVNSASFTSLGSVMIGQDARIDTTGATGGTIAIRGGQLTITDGATITTAAISGPSAPAGSVTINGAGVQMTGSDVVINGTNISVTGSKVTAANLDGSGGTIAITAGSADHPGNVTVAQNALLDASGTSGGSISIRGRQLVVDNATISADTGDADGAPIAIDINITGAVSLSNTNLPALTARTSGAGNAGDIVISSGSLNATFGSSTFDAALIDSHSMGSGHGGNVTITTGPLTMIGDPSTPWFFIDSGTGGDGNGGNVTITAGDAQFKSGGINTGDFTFGGVGSGGNLTIKANSLLLDTVSIITDSFNARAGTVTFESSGLLHITGNSSISSVSLLGQNPTAIQADQFVLDNNSAFLSGTALGNGGDVTVIARVVELSNGGSIATETFGDGRAGSIHITASDHVSLLNNPSDSFPSGLFTQSLGDPVLGTHGNSGNITINTPRLELTNGANLNSTTLTSGPGGDVIIHANSVSITGERSFDAPPFFALGGTRASGIYTKTLGSDLCSGSCGNAGNINITTSSLMLQNGGLLDSGTSNNGQGGNVTVSATGKILLSGTMLDGTPSGVFSRTTGTDPGSGNGGSILLNANSVMIQNGAQLSASSLGPGAAGSVTVNGTNRPAESVFIDGTGSGIFTNTQGSGTGGNIFVNANSVNLQTGAVVTAATTGAGPGGSIAITAGNTFASNASTVNSTATQATGGNINIVAGESVTLTNGASISASSTGGGNAGNIMINAGQSFLATNSSVTTQASQASGGTIKITTTPSGMVELINSTISASVLDGTGGGGSVNIDPQFVILQNSQILANAVQGPGGNISITTNLLLPDTNSVISASSQFGANGTVTVQSPNAPATGKIIPLSQKPLTATALLSQRCAALASGEFSSFTVAGRDSLPAEPGGWLASPLALAISESSGGTVTEARERASVGEAVEETPLLSLRQIAPPGFLTQAFAVDWSAGCTS